MPNNLCLRAFSEWYLRDWPRLPMDLPMDGIFRERRGEWSRGTVLFCDAPFNVELIVFKPNYIVQPHSHPNIACHDIPLSGSGELVIAGRRLTPCAAEGPPMARRVPVPAGVVHYGRSGPDGAAFLSIQRWLNDIAPTFISDDVQNVDFLTT